MKLGIWDALGLGAAVRDEEVVETQNESNGIVSRAIDALKNLFCSDSKKED
jgi:hypothetical protein